MINREIRAPGFVVYGGYDRELALASVGKGWADLINAVFSKAQSYSPGIRIIQVKEKWGGLRIYCDPYVEDFEKMVREVEKKSFTICEECGKPAKLRDGSWYKTLCDEHANGREPIEPF